MRVRGVCVPAHPAPSPTRFDAVFPEAFSLLILTACARSLPDEKTEFEEIYNHLLTFQINNKIRF